MTTSDNARSVALARHMLAAWCDYSTPAEWEAIKTRDPDYRLLEEGVVSVIEEALVEERRACALLCDERADASAARRKEIEKAEQDELTVFHERCERARSSEAGRCGSAIRARGEP